MSLYKSMQNMADKELVISIPTGNLEVGDTTPLMDSGPPPPNVIAALRAQYNELKQAKRHIPQDLKHVLELADSQNTKDDSSKLAELSNDSVSVGNMAAEEGYYQITSGEDRGKWVRIEDIKDPQDEIKELKAELDKLKESNKYAQPNTPDTPMEKTSEDIIRGKLQDIMKGEEPQHTAPTFPNTTPNYTYTTPTFPNTTPNFPNTTPTFPNTAPPTSIPTCTDYQPHKDKLDTYLDGEIRLQYEFDVIGVLGASAVGITINDAIVCVISKKKEAGFTPAIGATFTLIHEGERYDCIYPGSHATIDELGIDIQIYIRRQG